MVLTFVTIVVGVSCGGVWGLWLGVGLVVVLLCCFAVDVGLVVVLGCYDGVWLC